MRGKSGFTSCGESLLEKLVPEIQMFEETFFHVQFTQHLKKIEGKVGADVFRNTSEERTFSSELLARLREACL